MMDAVRGTGEYDGPTGFSAPSTPHHAETDDVVIVGNADMVSQVRFGRQTLILGVAALVRLNTNF
jgi:hypothetical protein